MVHQKPSGKKAGSPVQCGSNLFYEKEKRKYLASRDAGCVLVLNSHPSGSYGSSAPGLVGSLGIFAISLSYILQFASDSESENCRNEFCLHNSLKIIILHKFYITYGRIIHSIIIVGNSLQNSHKRKLLPKVKLRQNFQFWLRINYSAKWNFVVLHYILHQFYILQNWWLPGDLNLFVP